MSDNAPSGLPNHAGPTTVTCAYCRQAVLAGTRFCPNCGNQLLSVPASSLGGYAPPGVTPLPGAPPRNNTKMIIAVVIIVLIVLSVGGTVAYLAYTDMVKANEAAARAAALTNDKSGASSAVDNVQITCSSHSYDTSSLPYTATFYITLGAFNPSSYPMDTSWTLTVNYPDAGVVLTDSQYFHIPAQATAYPKWEFLMTYGQISALNNASSNQSYRVSLDRTFTVYGSYDNYDFTSHDTFNSSSTGSSSTGSSSSRSSFPSC